MSGIVSIEVRDEMGTRVPSLKQLNIVAGQAIVFRAVDVDSTLFFSPDLIEILTPKPGLSESLAVGADLTFTFADARPGSYEIVLLDPDGTFAQPFDNSPQAGDPVLIVSSGSGFSFGVTTNPIQTVHAAAQARGFMQPAEPEERTITTNPIQT